MEGFSTSAEYVPRGMMALPHTHRYGSSKKGRGRCARPKPDPKKVMELLQLPVTNLHGTESGAKARGFGLFLGLGCLGEALVRSELHACSEDGGRCGACGLGGASADGVPERFSSGHSERPPGLPVHRTHDQPYPRRPAGRYRHTRCGKHAAR